MAASARRRVLSIQQVFLLLAVLNGIVVLILLASAWRLLNEPWFSNAHAYTTIALASLLVLGVAISYLIVSQRVIRPLGRLVRESQAISSRDAASSRVLGVHGSDEIARLAQAFNGVLERQRLAIAQLDDANQRLRQVNRQVDDSIRYAALLQRSILPDRQLAARFGDEHFVLWQPRDQVGGDYYLFHGEGSRCLAGVADCAGHGVPGAMMTMLARAALDRFIQQVGLDSPAAILEATNAGMDLVLREAQRERALATSMDVGLVLIDAEAGLLRFAGARIALYWSDGDQVGVVKGDHRSLWDRRVGTYHDHDLPLCRDRTYYMTTDGLLDQAGGDLGFALGAERFCGWLREQARRPLPAQRTAFSQAIDAYRLDYPQRDDITMLALRVR